MRALAEFVMRGRIQAALVALCGNLLPLISPAAVGLVGLRRGLSEGLLVALWALLPSLLAFYVSDLNPMVILASIAGVAIVPLAAEVLKVSISWRLTLLFISVVSAALAILLSVLFSTELSSLQDSLAQLFAEIQKGQPNQQAVQMFVPERTFIVGLIGYIMALNAVLSLILARWWQALLYNPGGFQTEFHQLRLGGREAILLLVGIGFCQFNSSQYFSWGELLALPLLLSGIALVHFIVAHRKLGGHWLVIFYVGLVLIGPLSMALIVISCIDSIVNFRSRLTGNVEQ